MSYSVNVSARARARRASLQAIYQWQMAATDLVDLLAQYLAVADKNGHQIDTHYFQTLVTAVLNQHKDFDQQLIPLLDRPLMRLDPIEYAILRLACCEFNEHREIPYRVIINEWVNLAKQFGATDSHKYINAVLDKLAHSIRQDECSK